MVGNNSCGARSLRYGNVLSIDAIKSNCRTACRSTNFLTF